MQARMQTEMKLADSDALHDKYQRVISQEVHGAKSLLLKTVIIVPGVVDVRTAGNVFLLG